MSGSVRAVAFLRLRLGLKQVQEMVYDTTTWWLTNGLNLIHEPNNHIPALDPLRPDRATFVLKALLMSVYVRFSACLRKLLIALRPFPTVAQKLAELPRLLAQPGQPAWAHHCRARHRQHLHERLFGRGGQHQAAESVFTMITRLQTQTGGAVPATETDFAVLASGELSNPALFSQFTEQTMNPMFDNQGPDNFQDADAYDARPEAGCGCHREGDDTFKNYPEQSPEEETVTGDVFNAQFYDAFNPELFGGKNFNPENLGQEGLYPEWQEDIPESDRKDPMRLVEQAEKAIEWEPEHFLKNLLADTVFEGDADTLFRALLTDSLREATENISQFSVIGYPGEALSVSLRSGDLLIRRATGEGLPAYLGVLVDGQVRRPEEARLQGLCTESDWPGGYVYVVEAGPFPKTREAQFALCLTNGNGQLGYDQLVVRILPDSDEEAYDESVGGVNRTSPAYIRWVQTSLNRILGRSLAVDGIAGPQTRAAVRTFQGQKGLAVDGIVGPQTEAALIAAGAEPPPGSGTAPPVSPSVRIDPNDPRLDVSAKFSLQRMLRGDTAARQDATGIITAINCGQLAGIYGDDLRASADLARRHGTQRWLLIPRGEDAALVLNPEDALVGSPTIVFRGGEGRPPRDGIRSQPVRLDAALRKAWGSFQLLKSGQLSQCELPNGNDQPLIAAAAQQAGELADWSTETVVGASLPANIFPITVLCGTVPPPVPTPPACPVSTIASADPSALVRFPVGIMNYDGGTATVLGMKLRVRGSVFYPASTSGSGTPFNPATTAPVPILFIAYGNHAIARDPANPSIESGRMHPGFVSLPNHEGYNYLQQQLAQLGIIAVSVDCNEVSGSVALTPTNIQLRGELILASALHFQNLHGSSPIFAGRIDFSRLGLLGHSRGGEAVLAAAEQLLAGRIPGAQVRGVISLAPTNIGATSGTPTEFPYLVILPAADGDVVTNEGAQFYDRAIPSPYKGQLYM